MLSTTYHKLMLGFGLAGTLFAGYLSAQKFFTATCAFNEPCPYFLGYPACYFGLAMFFAMMLVALYATVKVVRAKWPAEAIITISTLGTLFAGYYTWGEVASYLAGTTPNYTLVLPTCSYGLVFYVLMLAISAVWYTRHRHQC